jgi:hypothetical protein
MEIISWRSKGFAFLKVIIVKTEILVYSNKTRFLSICSLIYLIH